jgi:hypothetical protein
MVHILNLSTEICFEIRNYLIFNSFLMNGEQGVPLMEEFIRKESPWSWRNFLSTSNNPHWKLIRKTTMIWRLNFPMSLKYHRDPSFCSLLNEKMVFPARQLELHFSGDREAKRLKNEPTLRVLNAQDRVTFDSIHSLMISHCNKIISLGSFPSLKYLKIEECENLASVGQMNNLRGLSLAAVLTQYFHAFLWRT